jgi:DNA-directed RNA polymerase subunit omega
MTPDESLLEKVSSIHDIDLEEKLVQKVGGKFKLTTLLQKRLIELNRGAPALVKVEDGEWTLRRIVCEEILQGKIELAPREEIGYTLEEEKARIEAEAQPEQEGDGEVIYGSDIKKIKEQRIKELSQLLNPKK